MNRYINIHTHNTGTGAGLEIVSFYRDFDKAGTAAACSLGLHPWYIEAGSWKAALERLRALAGEKNVLAIGECGLDKTTKTPWELQLEVFTAQIALAGQLQKPLIIHCVRAFEELLAVFRSDVPAVPVIVHGFNKKAAVAEKLLNAGFYLSFGKALLTNDTACETFSHMPAGRFFLETDDAAVDIAAIYKAAAALWKTSEETIISHAQNNFQKVFRS